jgi:hypothetical protein
LYLKFNEYIGDEALALTLVGNTMVSSVTDVRVVGLGVMEVGA